MNFRKVFFNAYRFSIGILKRILLILFLIFCSRSVEAGLSTFTDLIYLDEWLIERKIDLVNNNIQCRASIHAHASWFGGRVRMGPNNELIKPNWIEISNELLLESKLNKVKKHLNNCRSGFLFLPDVENK